MYTEQDFTNQLTALGIQPTDTVSVHLSLRSVGKIDTREVSGAEVLLNSLRKCLPEGLLLIPTHTWKYVNPYSRYFDMRTSTPCVGAVPLVALRMANAAFDRGDKTIVRSPHATHSVVAFGKNAEEYVKDDHAAVTPAPPFGCYGKLAQVGGKILLIGVGHESNTYLHAVDEILGIPERLEPAFPVFMRMYDGSIIQKEIQGHSNPICWNYSENYPNYDAAFDATGAIHYGRVGDALARLCDAKTCLETVKRLWERTDYDLCTVQKRIDPSVLEGNVLRHFHEETILESRTENEA